MTLLRRLFALFVKIPFARTLFNRIALRFVRPTTSVEGGTIHLNPDDPMLSAYLTFGVFERDEISFFRRVFSDDMVFLDVGANVGLYTGLALSTADFHGTVLCLEPHDESRGFLERTIESNRSADATVIVSSLAATDREGDADLYADPSHRCDNRIYPDRNLERSQSIRTDSLDNICVANGIEQVNFVKLDIQGAEARAVAGAHGILGRSEDCIVLSEFWPTGLSRCGSNPESYLHELEALGFALFTLRGTSLTGVEVSSLVSSIKGDHFVNIVGFKGESLDRVRRDPELIFIAELIAA